MSRVEKILFRVIAVSFFLRLIPYFISRFNTVASQELWAEDGSDFLTEAVVKGIPSIFEPIAASLFLIPRVIALLLVQFPLEYVPYLYSGTAAFLYSVVAFYVVKDSFHWLIPNRHVRIMFGCFTFVVSGTSEVFGNLVCLSYVFAWFLALTLLEDKPLRRSWFAAVWVFISLSSNIVSCLLPFAIIMAVRRRGYFWYAPVCCFFNLIIHLAMSFATSYVVSQPKTVAPLAFFQYTIENYLSRGLFTPLYGPLLSSNSLYSSEVFLLLFFSTMFVLVRLSRLLKSKPTIAVALIGLQSASLFFFALHAVARNYIAPSEPSFIGFSKIFSSASLTYVNPLVSGRHSWIAGLATYFALASIWTHLYLQTVSVQKRIRLQLLGGILIIFGLLVNPSNPVRKPSWNQFWPSLKSLIEMPDPSNEVVTNVLEVGPFTDNKSWASIIFIRNRSALTYRVNGGNV